MTHSPLITIVTPSYNRAAYLRRLYESLTKQTCTDFVWMIVDDGSTDDTLAAVDVFKAANAPFAIEYYHKQNGGKHTALNLAIDKATTPLFFIVDSDDMLTPDAIATIKDDWNVADDGMVGISYLRGYDTTRPIGDLFPKDHVLDTFNNVRVRQRVGGDKAEVWATVCLKELRFPVFEGERFIGESWMWTQVSDMGQMLFVNKIIYVCEYLEGGLTQSGRRLRVRCPQGGMTYSLLMMDRKFPMRDRLKNALLYVNYGFFAKRSVCDIVKCKHPLLAAMCLAPGYMLYRYWKRMA